MKVLRILQTFVLLMAPLLGVRLVAQTPIIGPTDALAFDYLDTDYSVSQVDHFEASYDGGGFVVLAAPKYQTLNGVSSYKFIPPQTTGTHNVALRACNLTGCGANSLPFAFALPVSSAPGSAPSNIRKVAR